MEQNDRGNKSGLTLRSRQLGFYCVHGRITLITARHQRLGQSQKHELTTQLYGISFLSFAVCDGLEYAVNDKQFFLPGRLVTFKCE
jgi:hypothetical protein